MGNCLNHQSAVTWVDDEEDWDSMDSIDGPRCDDRKAKRVLERLREKASKREHGRASSNLVKIKITKKRLEELLCHADMQGMDVRRVLSHLMSKSASYHEGRGQQWRPSLQSIPEDGEPEVGNSCTR